ncbi:hypothetical protein LEP1GSC194_0619 [Leptospira alstonii serovar Sichuan str. 79601]|uniref:Uncharacterized protein n=1 Tax=Leptospira alstonii serovar Sichuan str. 79601 TaxID=1218565 RepID=M6CIU7_9LEPT|nr:hypothetical protein LEP1GSC194_0619 [Leptospira alstonii serovar Sichuan str. 79601]
MKIKFLRFITDVSLKSLPMILYLTFDSQKEKGKSFFL